MTVTPIVTETAIISAAMAMDVRLSAPVTVRAAMRPSKPNGASNHALRRMAQMVSSGTQNTIPNRPTNRPANEATTVVWTNRMSSAPARISSTPMRVSSGKPRRTRSSRSERCKAVTGGTLAASEAGTAAANMAAQTPSAMPLTSVAGCTSTERTVSAKYRSLMVCVTNCTVKRPR